MNKPNQPIEFKQQNLLISVRNLQKTIHLCCELLPLLPEIKNVSNLMSIFQNFTKQQ